MIIQEGLSIQQKLEILSDAAKYDVACTSSGSERSGAKGHLGNTCAAGICHSFAADGRCISLLKILFTNECVFDCRYCVNRASNDVVRTAFTPEEICELTIQFYRRNYIEGLFLSSGVIKNPNYTMEQLYRTLFLLRYKYHFLGYIHVKGIPGADQVLFEKIGYLADRMSVNLEMPTAEGLRTFAPNKSRSTILKPIRTIKAGMETNAQGAAKGAYWTSRFKAFDDPMALEKKNQNEAVRELSQFSSEEIMQRENFSLGTSYRQERSWLPGGKMSDYVPAGQSTQMIIGASGETDYQIMAVTEALYRNFDMKRVFYSGFLKTTDDKMLPDTPQGPPLLREHRLYQADWLLRYYGFRADELLSPEKPDLYLGMDPKCGWAVNHLDKFPVEVMTAPYEVLLRVPGIGVKSARRIISARRTSVLDEAALKKTGVVLKRARFFLLCAGKAISPVDLEQKRLERIIADQELIKSRKVEVGSDWIQLSLFRDFDLDCRQAQFQCN